MKVAVFVKRYLKDNLEKPGRKQWIFLCQILIFVLICLLHALSSSIYVDFYPINGTFQNYNPVRRFLDGQIPYKDFADYLGLGHLYAGVLFTVILGGDYKASLTAFSFLTILSMGMLSFMLGRFTLKSKDKTMTVTNLLLLLLLFMQSVFSRSAFAGTNGLLDALNSALMTGNSARFVRGLILPVCCFLFWIGSVLLQTICTRWNWSDRKQTYTILIGTGAIGGVAGCWSNDYGISCWLCLHIMTLIVMFAKERNVLRAVLGMCIELLSSLLFVFVWVEIFTLGHFTEWFSSTFGTGGYQSWYYLSNKYYYIYDMDFSFLMSLQAFLCVAYLYQIFKQHGTKQSVFRYGIPAFANMVGFCAVNEYHLLSGGDATEIAYTVLFLSCLYEGICHAENIWQKKEFFGILEKAAVLLGIAWIGSMAKEELVTYRLEELSGKYMASLGGNMTSYYEDLDNAHAFLDGEKFFATYASAQEVVEGIYQPSGTDYIIHVLGDEQRRRYLEAFESGDFRYAASIRDNVSDYEYWCQRANWFFYRELYHNWHPVYANRYELYWERNERTDEYTYPADFQVTVMDVNESVKKLIVQLDEPVDGIADVYVEYDLEKRASLHSKLLFQTMVKVKNTGNRYIDNDYYETNYLRPKSGEYIPITIVNGYGEVTLTSCPERDTVLEIQDAYGVGLYTVGYHYVEVSDILTGAETEPILLIPNTKHNRDALEEAKGAWGKGKQIYFTDRTEDDSYIRLNLDINDIACDWESILPDGRNMVQLIK